MPSLLQRGQNQHLTEEANESRLVTKTRWIVEARNGHIKSIFKFFDHTLHLQHAKNLGDFFRIAAAIINKYYPLIHMAGVNAELAREMLEKSRQPNVVQAIVESENLQARNAQRWIKLTSDHVQNFPLLTLDFLRDLTIGVYQVNLSPSYVQDKLRREANEEFQLKVFRDPQNDAIPRNGLLRVRIFSIFRNATKYQLWIAFKPTDENEGEDDDSPVLGHYCTCKSGARSLGTCAHVASVVWFLGFARHDPNVRYPSTSLNDAILDAGNRP